jgi:hypothetical protein
MALKDVHEGMEEGNKIPPFGCMLNNNPFTYILVPARGLLLQRHENIFLARITPLEAVSINRGYEIGSIIYSLRMGYCSR